jgi:hypothetical protein
VFNFIISYWGDREQDIFDHDGALPTFKKAQDVAAEVAGAAVKDILKLSIAAHGGSQADIPTWHAEHWTTTYAPTTFPLVYTGTRAEWVALVKEVETVEKDEEVAPEVRKCDECGREPAVAFCEGYAPDGVECDMGGDVAYAFCERCATETGTDADDVLRCFYHKVPEWTFEDAFNKFGFNDGGSYHAGGFVVYVADSIKDLGYIVVYGQWGSHNTVIVDIIRPHPGVEPATYNFDDDKEFENMTQEAVAALGVRVYPPNADFRVGYDDVAPVLPHDILVAINNVDAPGFEVIDINVRRVLRMRGREAAIAAFKALKPTDILCGICLHTAEDDKKAGALTRRRVAELRELLVVPRCGSDAPHLFHRACLLEHLRRNEMEQRCPLCRATIVGEPSEEAKPASQETDV